MKRVKNVLRMGGQRATQNGMPIELTETDWLDILRKSRGQCSYCDLDVGMLYLTMDHVKPLSQKGRHHKSNVVAACSRCNALKQSRPRFVPNTLSLVEDGAGTISRTALAQTLGCRYTLLRRPFAVLGIEPVGISATDRRTVLFSITALDLVVEYFKARPEIALSGSA
jgi:hypothetical protein